MTPEDRELLTLLDLDGQQYQLEKYWVKIEARTVPKDAFRPHGIKYSLTLHDRNNRRILGFDNAHAPATKGRRGKKYGGRIVTWDHVHHQQEVQAYAFSSASRLIEDFWDAVEKIVG
jgi:hypothetical protein